MYALQKRLCCVERARGMTVPTLHCKFRTKVSQRPARKTVSVEAAVRRGQPIFFRARDEMPVSAADREVLLDGLQGVADSSTSTRPRVVVLGSGWASMGLIKALPDNIRDTYDVVVVSPRNYFLYTPLLPAVAAGSMEERSIVEPVRNLVHGKGRYFEAMCTAIDPVHKEITACFPKAAGGPADCFKLPYDLLVVGVGSVNNTFGISGVSEHCCFLKSLEDAHNLRERITDCFERAALPNASDETCRQLLSFVVCGGGPTGVEVAAELHDMVFDDLSKDFPGLMQYVKIRVVEMLDHVLASYTPRAGEFAADLFKKEGIELLLNHRVLSVQKGAVRVAGKSGAEQDIPFGACVWSTGIAMNPLVKQLQQAFPKEQTHNRCALTDEFLRVEGSDGSIWAFGDASTIHLPFASEHVDELFDEADTDKDGLLNVEQLQALLHENEEVFPHLARHARFLDGKKNRFSGLVGVLTGSVGGSAALAALDLHGKLDKDQFRALLSDMDSNSLKALPATAQVAKQEGEFVADLLLKAHYDPELGTLHLEPKQEPFKYFHKGSLAYVGQDQAIMDVPVVGAITGHEAGFMWKGYETIAQISPRNMMLVLQSFVRTKLFGRDFSNV